MITCVTDNLLVKNIPFQSSEKIYIPPQFQKQMKFLQKGEVISAGEGNERLPMPVKPGNIVVYAKGAGFELTLNGETYQALKSCNIVCAR